MPHSSTLINKRNEYLRLRFRYHREKNPKWTIIAVLEAVAEDVFLEPTTVAKILKQDGQKVPCVDTVAKYSQLALCW
jgi:hypothetical protein